MLRRSAFQVLFLLALPAIAASQEIQPPKQASSQPKVVRDRVKGSIHHGEGKGERQRVIGQARILDARTLEFDDGTRIRLDIVAPELDQMAMLGDSSYSCGKEAAEFLRKLVGDRPVMCFNNPDATDGPWVGYVGDTNIEHAMIINGWALADHSSLHAAEIIARDHKRGLWRGKFLKPDEWRAGERRLGETTSAASKAVNESRDNKPPAIVGRWVSLDRHIAMGSLFQPVHGVRKREAVIQFQQTGDKLTGFGDVEHHKAISNQERWKQGHTDFREVRFANNQLILEFDIDEWISTAGPMAIETKQLKNSGTIRVEARLEGDRLIGRWRMFLADETEVFRGEWEATRVTEPKEKP